MNKDLSFKIMIVALGIVFLYISALITVDILLPEPEPVIVR